MKKDHIVSIDSQGCIGCGLCVKDCPSNALALAGKKAEVLLQDCIKCGHCVAICPKNAVSMSGYEDAPEPVVPGESVDPDVLLRQMKARRSMRYFAPKALEDGLIEKIIEAGRFTPTGSNKQGVSYVVLRDRRAEFEKVALGVFRRLKKFADVFTSRFRHIVLDDQFLFKGAPAVIVVKSTDPADGALAASTMELMAQSLGLGVLYSGFFVRIAGMSRKLKKMLQVARGEKIVATLVLGYGSVKYVRTAQREKPKVLYV